MAKIKNIINNISDTINWKLPLKRTQRDALAMLNPKLAQRKGYTPTRTRKEYRMANSINRYNPIDDYKDTRHTAIASSVMIPSIIGGVVFGVNKLTERENKKQKQLETFNERQAQLRINSGLQDSHEGNSKKVYGLDKMPKGGPAFASGIQDLQQKRRNSIHPDKGRFFDEDGTFVIGRPFRKPSETESYLDNWIYKPSNDDTATYVKVRSKGYGMPVERVTNSTKRPIDNILNESDVQLYNAISGSGDATSTFLNSIKNIPTNQKELEDLYTNLENFGARTFNTMSSMQSGPRFISMSYDPPINTNVSNKGSGTAKRMKKSRGSLFKSSNKPKNKYF